MRVGVGVGLGPMFMGALMGFLGFLDVLRNFSKGQPSWERHLLAMAHMGLGGFLGFIGFLLLLALGLEALV